MVVTWSPVPFVGLMWYPADQTARMYTSPILAGRKQGIKLDMVGLRYSSLVLRGVKL